LFVALIQAPTFSRWHTKTHAEVKHATQKEADIDHQQHSCEKLICQCHQTILRLLYSAATANKRWRVRELYWRSTFTLHKGYNRTIIIARTTALSLTVYHVNGLNHQTGGPPGNTNVFHLIKTCNIFSKYSISNEVRTLTLNESFAKSVVGSGDASELI